jgi:NAD(P)-dependent dehydrogenase (short-subunit alcohol dehydrogenase family)
MSNGEARLPPAKGAGLLEGKVGLVTGAAQGLGRAVAELAAREGSRVVLSDVQVERGQAAAKEIESRGGEVIFVEADVSDRDQVAALVARTVARFGRLDWACNNAVGGTGDFGPLHEIDERSWNRTVDVCLKGVFHGLKFEVPAMLAGGGGSIINITTAGVFKGEAMLAAYVAAKGGVHALTLSAASEYSARGVRVNSVAPGGFETPAILRYFQKFPEFKERTIATHAMRRLGRPEEVAEPVIWLASDRASFVTGACLQCDGGALVSSHLL